MTPHAAPPSPDAEQSSASCSRRDVLRTASGSAVAAVLAQFGATRAAVAEAVAEVPVAEAGGDAVTGDAVTGDALRPLYGLDPKVLYLNHASIGTQPQLVRSAHGRYLQTCENNPWLYMWSDAWVEPLAGVRSQCADLFSCSADAITFSHNTTETFNVLAQGLPLGRGDEVLFGSLNHAGASVCWRHHGAARGYSVRQFDVPLGDAAQLSGERLLQLYDDAIGPNTKVLVFPHVDNMVGIRHPMASLAKLAKQRGVRWVAVDGAQTAGMLPVDLGHSGVDVYATSAHKWLQAPKGLGVAYLNREIQNVLRPMWVTWGQSTWQGTVRIFEDYGTRNLASVLALGDALTFHRRWNDATRQTHHRTLWQTCQELVDRHDQLTWCSPRQWEMAAPLYSIGVSGDVRQLARQLFEHHGIVVRPFDNHGLNCLRCSPNLANSEDDLERLVSALV